MIYLKKLAYIIRIITVSPILVLSLLSVIFFKEHSFMKNNVSYIIAITTLVLLPLLAYPIQRRFNIIKVGDKRKSERALAIIFSICGYLIGFILAFILKAPGTEKVLYLSYLMSVILISIFSFGFQLNASGHMAGISGPLTIIVYLFGFKYLLLISIPITVIWASLKLNRHTLIELTVGSLIPIGSIIVSMFIFGVI